MELYPGVYQIQSLFGGRNLFQYLFVGDNCIVVDTGISETPEKVIFPYMDRLNLSPARLTLAVTTHPDIDHQGGNDTISAGDGNNDKRRRLARRLSRPSGWSLFGAPG